MTGVKRYAEGDEVTKVFQVENSVGKRQYVLAINPQVALSFSKVSRHILDERNGSCKEWPLSVIERRDPKFGGSLRRALSSKLQGVVERQNDFAIVERQVFMPIAAT